MQQSTNSAHIPKDLFNTLRLRQNGHLFPDDIFRWIFLNENVWISLRISKFVPRVGINNIQALVQIMAWRHPGAKPLSELMMVSLLTHICVTRPQWVNVVPCDRNNHSNITTEIIHNDMGIEFISLSAWHLSRVSKLLHTGVLTWFCTMWENRDH